MAAFHDPIFNHWQRLSLDSIPVNAYIHGGAGGLLCCQRVENGSLVLCVCNPLTRVWRDLLPMPHPHTSTCFVKMVANRKLNSYKVIRVGQLQPLPPGRNNGTRIELCTEVYDSVEGSWRCIYDTPTDVRFIQGCSVCTDSLHCRTSTTRRMLAYGLKQGTWTELSTRNLDSILDAKMVDCEGKPFLVTRVWKGGLMETVDIWGQKQQSFIRDCQDGREPNLDDQPSAANGEWEEVARMPPGLFQEWSSSAGLFYHVGVGEYIYSTCLARGSSKLVTYSLRRKKWHLVDGCPVSQSNTYLGGFEFRPRLDAAV